MQYRRVGSSGLVVSAIGFGCNNLGRPNSATEDAAEAIRVVQAAVDAADGGGTESGFFGDFGINAVFGKHFCAAHPLCHFRYFLDRTQIVKKIVAVVKRLKGKDCLKEIILHFIPFLMRHNSSVGGWFPTVVFVVLLYRINLIK